MTYYNTTRQTGDQLEIFKRSAQTQDQAVLNFLRRVEKPLTRDEIHADCLSHAPTSSLTRSLNTLLNKGKVYKLDMMRPGKYGRPQHLWVYNPNAQWTEE